MLYHPIARLDTGKREIKMVFSHRSFRTENPLLGRSRSGVGVGVGVDIFRSESELESESLKTRRLRSPAHDRFKEQRGECQRLGMCPFFYYLAGNLIGRKLSGRIMVKHEGLPLDLDR